MASIFELVGGQDASKVKIDRDTGVATLKATITELGGRDISFQVRETDTTTGAAAVTTYTQAVAAAALTITPAIITLDENPIPGVDIGQLTATGGTGNYTWTANGGNNEIEVAPDGLVSPKAALGQLANPSAWSYATNTSFTFPISVSDGVNTATANLTIVLLEVATAPVVADASISVSEAATVGTQVATPANFSTSAANFDEVVFVSGNDAGKFAVDPTTGIVTLAATVDALVTSGYAPVLRFSSNAADGSALSSFATMNTTILISNRAPTLAIANATTSLPEATDTAAAVSVGTITVTEIDGGLGTNVVTISGTDAASFELGAASTVGSVTSYPLLLKAGTSLDFTVKTSYAITITSADASLPGQDQTLNYTLTITDSNTAPVAPTTASFTIADDAAVNDVVGTVTVTDAQSGVTASIVADDPTSPGRFAIANNGQITVAQALPSAATQGSHAQTVRWTDDRGAFAQTVITYTITASARISDATYAVDEDAIVGFTVATLPSTFNGEALTYAITAGNTGDAFAFAGNALQTAAILDFETLATYSLTVSATDTNGSETATLTINLNNITEPITAPSISGGPLSVNENAPIGTVVGNLTVDTGNDPNATIEMRINGPGSPLSDFACALNGQVTTLAIFDFEAQASYSITATITNAQGSDSVNFTISITNQPEFTFTPESSFDIPSDALEVSGGTIIGAAHTLTTAIFAASFSGPTNAEVLYTVDSATDCKFKVSGVDATSYTHAQLLAGDVAFVAVSTGTTANYFNTLDALNPSITVTVSDTGSTGLADLTVTYAPTFLAAFAIANIADAGVIPNTELRAISVGDTTAQTQIVLGIITGGQFERVSAPGTAIFTWFQSEIDAGDITIIQTGAIAITNLQTRGSNNILNDSTNLSIANPNAPTLSLAANSGSLSEAADTSSAITVTTIAFSNWVTPLVAVAGTNASLFELANITGSTADLNLKAGTSLDHETVPSLAVDVTLDDTDNGVGVDATESFTLTITNANEAPSITNGTGNLDTTAPAGTAIATVNASDPETLVGATYSIISLAGGSTNAVDIYAINTSTGAITRSGTGTASAGTDTINVQVEDAGGLTATGTITVTVAAAATVDILNGIYYSPDGCFNDAYPLNASMTDGSAAIPGTGQIVNLATNTAFYVKLPAPTSISGVKVGNHDANRINDRDIETSTDNGATWTTQATISGYTANTVQEVTFSSAANVTDIRIIDVRGTGFAGVSILEFVPRGIAPSSGIEEFRTGTYTQVPGIDTLTLAEAIDGNTAVGSRGVTPSSNSNANERWLKCDVGTGKQIAGVLLSGTTNADTFLNGAVIQTSPDDSTWTTQATIGAEGSGSPFSNQKGELEIFTWTAVSAQYIRVYRAAGVGAGYLEITGFIPLVNFP